MKYEPKQTAVVSSSDEIWSRYKITPQRAAELAQSGGFWVVGTLKTANEFRLKGKLKGICPSEKNPEQYQIFLY